jgi:pimeloyl-ACP methyl ester carboxylesterase
MGSSTLRQLVGAGLAVASLVAPAAAQTTAAITLRGQPQTLHLYGLPSGRPVVVSSGDGGWLHLAPQISEFLASHGYFVVGFDSKAYLESFTGFRRTLAAAQEPSDYRTLIEYARQASGQSPALVGVSEGGALSVLAAADPLNHSSIRGVVGVGLGDLNELAWRWTDSVIYVTHGVPREPTFSVVSIVQRIAPVPLAVINSTHDEFVPSGDAARIIEAARNPKRLWQIEAADHRFSDRQEELHLRLLDALHWMTTQTS